MFYKKNVGNISISNLQQINSKRYLINDITYHNKFTLSNNTIYIEQNTVNVYSENTKILSLDNINWNNLFYKFLPIFLELNISKHYELHLYSKESEYMEQKFKDTKISFKFDLSLLSISSSLTGIRGTLMKIQNTNSLHNIASMLKIPLFPNLYNFVSNFLPLHFNIENKNNQININIRGVNLVSDIIYKSQETDISIVLYKNSVIECAITANTNVTAKCRSNINNFLYGNTTVTKLQSEIFLNFTNNNINFLLFNPVINIDTNNVNILSKHRNCRIKGILLQKISSVKANLQKKCRFSINKIIISPVSLQLLHQNKKYILSLFIYKTLFRSNNYLTKLSNTSLSAEISFTPKNIESNFKINANIYYEKLKTQKSKLKTYKQLQMSITLDNIVEQLKKISLSGKVNFNIESKSTEFSNLKGNIDNIKINNGVLVVNNKQEISFVDLEIDYEIQLNNYLKNKNITDIGVDDFYCQSSIKTIRKNPKNIEILGNFSNCGLFFNDIAQVYNTSGFWRFLTDTELENIEFYATANGGTIAIPTKQYNLSKDHIILVSIPIKRSLNIIETHANVSFIPQNEYINADLFTFIQQRSNDLLLTSEGKIKFNIKSNNFLTKFSGQINLNTQTKKYNIPQLKSSFFLNIKNIAQLKNSFQELFEFVNLQGYFVTRGTLTVKNNKIENIDSTISFIISDFTLDKVQIKKIRGKLPIKTQKTIDNVNNTKKGYIKFSIDQPAKVNFSTTISKVIPPCIFIKNIHIKYGYISITSSKFNICLDPSKQSVNTFDIPIEKVEINIAKINYISKILSIITSNKGICNVRLNNAAFNCIISFNILSNHFLSDPIKVSIVGKYTKSLNMLYELSANFSNINLQALLQNFGFQKSLTGKYNLHIDKLKIMNDSINEVEGYIENADADTKKIFSSFFNSIVKELFNIKMKDIKMQKNFNNLGLYFHYIKEKLIIKPLYYIENNNIKKYTIKDLKNRQTLLTSKGKKDCILYGKGANTITLCTKGGIIISIEKLLKIQKRLLPHLKKTTSH